MDIKIAKGPLCYIVFWVLASLLAFASSARAGIAGSDAAWQPVSGEIPVCWENSAPRYDQQMNWVKDAVTKTWQQYGNLNFTGWGACSPTSTPKGIRIRIDDSNPLVKALGRRLDGVIGGMVLNFDFQRWGAAMCK